MNTYDKYALPPLPNDLILQDKHILRALENYAVAAVEADRKLTAKQLSAYESLVASLEAKCTHMRKMYDELKDRTNPDLLASERAANAVLTAELEADRKTYNPIGEGTIQQLHDVLLYLQNETMKLEAAYGSNFKKEATGKARVATEKMKEAVYAIKNTDRQRRGSIVNNASASSEPVALGGQPFRAQPADPVKVGAKIV